MNTLGYYKQKQYPHHPDSERTLFHDAITEYSVINEGIIKGVEIGVLYADTSRFLISINERINLIGIDPIIPDSMNVSLIGNLSRINTVVEQSKGRFKFINDYSFNVIDKVDEDLDFVFIDGSHHYEDVKKDFELYSSKTKKNGLIFFHDSRMYRGGADFHDGSSRYVEDLIKNNPNYQLIGEAFSLTCFKKIW